MPTEATMMSADPLATWSAGVRSGKGTIPLASTRYDVRILGALALVTTRRVFRNVEANSIEATLTFPVPVHAVLHGLRATIDGRTVVAKARARAAARETYETAIDTGRTAVLHEEVLRGIHMLSIAHIPPGAEIAVEDNWAMALTALGRDATLWIPVTVGDVYGRSPLPDSDDLIGGGPAASADLIVSADSGRVRIDGRPAGAGASVVPLTRPVEIRVEGFAPRPLAAPFGDGRTVRLSIEPAAAGDARLDVDILVDQSGSMSERGLDGRSKHEAVLSGLNAAAAVLRDGDVVRLWRFDNSHSLLGSAHNGHELVGLSAKLTGPHGGTEIGAALAGVAARAETRTVVIVTDGKSHALDVQSLARTNRRFIVLLVGEDSLEANIGHLAAVTGGEIFVAATEEVGRLFAAAIAAARGPAEPVASQSATVPDRIDVRRAGMSIRAELTTEPLHGAAAPEGVSAFSAGLMMTRIDEAAAAALAVRHGLVTHLTSLVLVDEAGAVSEGLPATRKVALPEIAMSTRLYACTVLAPGAIFQITPGRTKGGPLESPRTSISGAPPSSERQESLAIALAKALPWEKLVVFDTIVDVLSPEQVRQIDEIAGKPDLVDLARQHGLEPRLLVLGLLASWRARESRSAARIARRLLGPLQMSILDVMTLPA